MLSIAAVARCLAVSSLVAAVACTTPTPVPAQGAMGHPTSCAGASLSLPPETVVASLAGAPVTLKDLGDDVSKAEGKALRDYCEAVHSARAGALDGFVTQKLVEQAAKAAGKEPDVWVQEQVEQGSKPPTDQEIQAFYDQRKRDGAPPLEAVRDQVVQLIMRERNLTAMQDLFIKLKKDAKLEEKLPDVRPPPVVIANAAHTSIRGGKGAKVKVVQFADFQCPYCSRAAESMKQVEAKYGEKIEVSYRHFPLRSIHPSAQRAAEVAQCAAEQGKFWEMHDELYQSQQQLDDIIGDGLHARAEKLKLDAAKLDECLASGRTSAQVEMDLQAGNDVGVEGTPSVFVNGRQVSGGATLEALSAAIDSEL